ncbi:MAG: hypothetical protein KGI41_01205 [Patescibacteria group bacterium]|nr:hypothetical protein [Patescibacteria group bacterium]MDE1965844.1 hypothetical protein [Patescibacteria group bacterium]
MEPTAETAARARVTPKDFFMWAGAMLALYWSVVSFVFLIFNYIDYGLPNVLSYRPDPYAGGMPYEMASLLVLAPVYVALALLIRRSIARDPSRRDVWVRRWAVLFTLFAAGATVAIDVITLLTSFFRGEELTLAFLLKVLVVLIVAILAFGYFTYDLRGYWDVHLRTERYLCGAFALIALASIVVGFFIVGTPADARLMRLDAQKTNDLSTIQWQVVNYWQQKAALPATLAALADPLSGSAIPTDPQTGAAYGYRATGTTTFELCADFNRPSLDSATAGPSPASLGSGSTEGWAHAAGQACFARTIDPERYPPAPKTLR